jgi:hypothetical protein
VGGKKLDEIMVMVDMFKKTEVVTVIILIPEPKVLSWDAKTKLRLVLNNAKQNWIRGTSQWCGKEVIIPRGW